MSDKELIVSLAKMLAEQKSIADYYRNRCDSLEAESHVRDNTTESGDTLPLDAVGTANKVKINV